MNSNGNGATGISVNGFEIALIPAAEGDWVRSERFLPNDDFLTRFWAAR